MESKLVVFSFEHVMMFKWELLWPEYVNKQYASKNLFCNNYRYTGSCKNTGVVLQRLMYLSSLQLPTMIISYNYKTISKPENQHWYNTIKDPTDLFYNVAINQFFKCIISSF